LGQPDARGPLTGGGWSLTDGFWSLVTAVQNPEAPALTLTRNPEGSITVSWPSPSSGFVLQQNVLLEPDRWWNSPFPISDDGSTKSIAVSSPLGHLIFRLRK
jgi:hypothetical protein